jgi:hypothetical protein
MIDKVVHNLEARSVEFLDLLHEPGKKWISKHAISDK